MATAQLRPVQGATAFGSRSSTSAATASTVLLVAQAARQRGVRQQLQRGLALLEGPAFGTGSLRR